MILGHQSSQNQLLSIQEESKVSEPAASEYRDNRIAGTPKNNSSSPGINFDDDNVGRQKSVMNFGKVLKEENEEFGKQRSNLVENDAVSTLTEPKTPSV